MKVQHELSQLARDSKVFEVGKDIHVSEGVYSNDRTVSWSFLDMEQRMAKLVAVRVQEVYRPFLADELASYFLLELL